ncbi:MAG: hypothetical protein ACTSWN_07200 [Promethearchaeota archaeon]
MARLGRKKIYLDFDTSESTLKQIQEIKKKIKVTMVMRMKRMGKLEIDVRGSKEDVQNAIMKIKEIIRAH